jgi:hypothetical protein
MTQRQGTQLKWRLNRDQGVPVEAVPFTLRSFLKLMVESLKILARSAEGSSAAGSCGKPNKPV